MLPAACAGGPRLPRVRQPVCFHAMPLVHFVHADRIEGRHGAADRVVEGAVNVEDPTAAVAAEREGVGGQAHPGLAHVEDVLASVGRSDAAR
jgi:hypothetical protein